MFDFLIEPWSWGAWMWRGMLASLLVAIPCAVLGVFLYLRRMSLLSDALAHVALPGIVAAFLLSGEIEGPWLLIGAVVTGLGAAALIEALSRRPNIRTDAAIGIVFTVLFAIGIILLSTVARDVHIDTQCVLFGNVLGISDTTLHLLGFVAPAVLILVAIFYRWLALSSFDASLAVNLGIPVAAVHYGLMSGVSITAVAGFEAVGAILVIALIIVPAATAHVLADRLLAMIGIAVAHAVTSCVVGMYASIWLNCSTAGAIVVSGGLLYGLAFLFAPRHGLLPRLRTGTQRGKSTRVPASKKARTPLAPAE